MTPELLHHLNQAAQVAIAVLSPTAAWLSQQRSREDRQRWASIVGLSVQPAWFYSAWFTQSWGTLLASLVFTWIWWGGFVAYWRGLKS